MDQNMPDYNRILITGAAGSLGGHLRKGLAPLANHLRLVDRVDLGVAAPYEELRQIDLADRAAAIEATKDCDAIVHFGAPPREQTFEEIVTDTLPASYHMYEGARLHGVKRVIYASSIHAIGFHEINKIATTDMPHRPDTFYGMTKCFTENLASMYWDKFGLESVCLRIASCFPEPANRRMLWSWLSFEDMVRLVTAALTAPRVGFSVIYGTSDNAQQGVSNAGADHIGYRPQDRADDFAAKVHAATERPDPTAFVSRVIGGEFAAHPHPDDVKN